MLDMVKLDGNILCSKVFFFYISCSSLVPFVYVCVINVISMHICRHLLAPEEAGLV